MVNIFSFGRHLGLIGITQGLIQLRSFFLIPLLTKILGPYEFGLWSQIIATAEFFLPLISLGLHGALVRFLAAEVDKKRIQEGFYSVFTIVVVLSIIFSCIIFLASGPIAAKFFDNRADLLKLVTLIIIFQSANTILLAYFRTFKQIGKYSFFVLLENYASLLIIFLIVFSGYHIAAVIWTVIVFKALLFIYLSLSVYKQIGFCLPKFQNVKNYLHYSLPSLPSNVAGWFVQLSDRYVIAYFVGVTAVGYYSPAYALGAMILLLVEPFSFVLTPYLSDLYDNRRTDEVQKYIYYSLKYFLVLAIPAVTAVSFLSRPILEILSTREIATSAYLVTPAVALSFLFYGLLVIIGEIIFLVKKTKIIALTWILAGILNVVLNIVLVPRLGIIAAGLTTLIAYLFVFFLVTYFAKKYLIIKFDFVIVGKSLISSMIIVLMIALLKPSSLFDLLIAGVVGGCLYVGTCFIFRIFSVEEIRFMKSLLFNNKKTGTTS